VGAAAVPAIVGAGVGAVDLAKRRRETAVVRTDERVVVVAHERVGDESHLEALAGGSEQA
jgi:hypothetical protein